MAEMDEQERKIVNEFCHLLEKSKQLFNGLRDLPQYGHKQWQAYFGRTFDIYTKLWKYQQQHRQILDAKFGLKRWQIGEIASKIGQLYYHYYLRTSETNYLNEAFSFYAAIRGRAYYTRTAKDDRNVQMSDLMVKKLRYYARFIVVCLLLKRMKLVRDLVRELSKQIDEYTATYEPEDQLEWSLVLAEIKSFIDADNTINVLDMDSNTIVLSHRLSGHNTPPVEKTPLMTLTLQEILIVGNCNDQVKFSELTIDMFRMLQTLEREPQEDITQLYDTSPAPTKMAAFNGDTTTTTTTTNTTTTTTTTTSNPATTNLPSGGPGSGGGTGGGGGGIGGPRTLKRDNPHKYLLYKPTFSQLMVFLASGFKELPANGAMLLYISADPAYSNAKHPQDPAYDFGGVITNSKRDNTTTTTTTTTTTAASDHSNASKRALQLKDMHCFYPGDLYAFTRKPLFIVVDSENSAVFGNMPHFFGQPLVILMSPQDTPTQFQDQHHRGNLFTLFLHSPLMGLCLVSSLCDIPMALWEKCQTLVDRFSAEASRLVARGRSVDPSFLQFFGDDFLRLLILRYIFCSTVLRAHRVFKGRQFYPRTHPALPEAEILDHPALYSLVLDLAAALDVSHLYYDSHDLQ
ncbi:protein SCAI-like isoform X2 [Eriocheir sinensis]|uniref:protein SCAI-like isoform X2 n=1 Tax=Eriocheir sinensis TaxID=95602 RepID=UPI0021C6EF97|nr:protein SCAI-like isoform X2 [Eriocheir sinensis]